MEGSNIPVGLNGASGRLLRSTEPPGLSVDTRIFSGPQAGSSTGNSLDKDILDCYSPIIRQYAQRPPSRHHLQYHISKRYRHIPSQPPVKLPTHPHSSCTHCPGGGICDCKKKQFGVYESLIGVWRHQKVLGSMARWASGNRFGFQACRSFNFVKTQFSSTRLTVGIASLGRQSARTHGLCGNGVP